MMQRDGLQSSLVGLLLLLAVGFCQGVQAEIYKWVDDNGRTQFSDQAPKTGRHDTVELTEITTFKRVTVADVEADDAVVNKQSSKRIVMYSASWCGACKNAKRYFKQKGIAFKEYDIETSRKGQSDFKRMKGRGVPIILVGNKRMNGFNPQKFETLYQSKG